MRIIVAMVNDRSEAIASLLFQNDRNPLLIDALENPYV